MKKCMNVIYRLVMKKIYDKCTSLSAIHFNCIILKLKQNKTEKTHWKRDHTYDIAQYTYE